MDRVEYGTDGYPYKLSMSTGIDNTEQYPTVEAIPKADYEDRLKADMVAMLTELLLETEEMDCEIDHDFEGYYNGVVACQKRIQQKINALKENKE